MTKRTERILDQIIYVLLFLTAIFFAGSLFESYLESKKVPNYQIEEFQKDEVIVD